MNCKSREEREDIEVRWRKSRRSQGNGACVEVGEGRSDVVPVRDSKVPTRVLGVRHTAWTAFVAHVREGLPQE